MCVCICMYIYIYIWVYVYIYIYICFIFFHGINIFFFLFDCHSVCRDWRIKIIIKIKMSYEVISTIWVIGVPCSMGLCLFAI